MQSNKKLIGNILFFAAVFGLTLYGVFRGEDLNAMMEALTQADVKWLIPGVILVLFFIWCESIILWYMMKSYGIRLKKRCCFLFSSVGCRSQTQASLQAFVAEVFLFCFVSWSLS